MRRRTLPVLWLLLLAAAQARAGDPPAHTAAMVTAAQKVAREPDFAQGVGAPRLPDGRRGRGSFPPFLIPTGTPQETACPYASGADTRAGCPYSDPNGRGINDPDLWSCTDSAQPSAITIRNRSVDFGWVEVAGVVASLSDGVKMTCNWNHFKTNPTPALGPEYSAEYTAFAVKADTFYLLGEIAAEPPKRYCDQDTWIAYYKKATNGIHYLQDTQTEHHAVGNQDCSPSSLVPTESYNRSFRFSEEQGCFDFLESTRQKILGPEPSISCDGDVVQPVGKGMSWSNLIWPVYVLCYHKRLALACMGLERTLRHHCQLPGSKPVMCAGERNDHNVNPRYCEGEIHSADEDFLGKATAASVPPLEEAARLWALFCQQPDDPCDLAQCDRWCRHSVPRGDLLDPGRQPAGYCVSTTPDATCGQQHCQCGWADECGARGQPCCSGNTCHEAADQCALATGTCVPANTPSTCPAPPPPGGTEGDAAGDPHLRTFEGLRYDMQAVGELTLVRDPGDGMEVQIRTRPWGSRTDVAINIAAAARVGTDVLSFYSGGAVHLNHALVQLGGGRTLLPGRGAVYRRGLSYSVVWPDNSQLLVDLGREFINVRFFPAEGRRGHLIGPFDGLSTRTLVTRDGRSLSLPLPFADFYGVYAESWRITQRDSLFDYGTGETTETYTDRSFPRRLATTQALPEQDRQAAMLLCQSAGVSPGWMEACVLDVGATQDPAYAHALAALPSASDLNAVQGPGCTDATDLGCGGGCAPCGQGKACLADRDCQSARCSFTGLENGLSLSSVVGAFYPNLRDSCVFLVQATDSPGWTQTFPTINFNPPPGTVPGDTSGTNTSTRPFTDVLTDRFGRYRGTLIAAGGGYQAGIGDYNTFAATFTGTLNVGSAGTYTLRFFSDDGFIFGVGGGATAGMGNPMVNPPLSGKTLAKGLPVLAAYNQGSVATPRLVTVSFPAAGAYPFEADYTECNLNSPASFTIGAATGVLVPQHGVCQ